MGRVHSLGVGMGVTAVSASQMKRIGPKEVKHQVALTLKGLPPRQFLLKGLLGRFRIVWSWLKLNIKKRSPISFVNSGDGRLQGWIVLYYFKALGCE